MAVSYTHLRAHETVLDLVCRLLLEKNNNTGTTMSFFDLYCFSDDQLYCIYLVRHVVELMYA